MSSARTGACGSNGTVTDSSARTNPAAAALTKRAAPGYRPLVEAAVVSPNTGDRTPGPSTASTLARRPASRGRDARRLPRRAPRAGESHVERVGGDGRGALPGPGSLASRARPGERTAWVLANYRRTAVGRGPRPGAPLQLAADSAAVLATCDRPRPRGRGAVGRPDGLRHGLSTDVRVRRAGSTPRWLRAAGGRPLRGEAAGRPDEPGVC